MMKLPLDQIHIGPRQRKKIDPRKYNELKASIEERGLLIPPGIRWDEGEKKMWLVFGERRLKALKELHAEGKTFLHGGLEYPPGSNIPFLDVDAPNDLAAMMAEFDENELREALDWVDRAQALADIHKASSSTVVRHTAEAIADKIEKETGQRPSVGHLANKVHRAVALQPHLSNPTIAAARNETEAYNLLLKQTEERAIAEVVRRSRAAKGEEVERIEVRHADLITTLPALDAGTVDLILADPPYGLGASEAGFRERSVHHHNYEDDLPTALAVAQSIFVDGFRVCQQRANLLLFCDIRVFNKLADMGKRAGWEVFPTPILWQKSHSEGLAPWGQRGFRRTYETILYATKGHKYLFSSPVDILDFKRVARSERTYAAEKPVELLRYLIEASTLPNEMVLDPCCGSGSTLVAAAQCNRFALGLERDEDAYNIAVSNVHTKGTPNVNNPLSDPFSYLQGGEEGANGGEPARRGEAEGG